MGKLILFLFLINVQYILSSNLPMQFVTSSNSPTVSDAISHQQSKRVPGPVVVNSRPLYTVKDGPIEAEDNVSAETKIGAWRRWFSKENITKSLTANSNEKTFTQQQILDKLFSDYHKHLKEQFNGKNLTDGVETSRYHNSGSYRPRPTIQSPWPIDIETVDDSRPTPSAAMLNNKYGHQIPPHLQSNPPKDGWVSLEPVPWSSSKVSKWTPNNRVPTSTQAPASQAWGFNGGYPANKPSWNQDRPQTAAWAGNKPSQWSTEKPLWIDHNRPNFDLPNNKPTWSEIPSKPLWSETSNKPTWAEAPNKPNWSDAPHKPTWDETPSKPSWVDSSNKPLWSDAPIKPLWTDGPNKPGWSDVQKPTWTDLTSKPTILNNNQPIASASWGSIRPPSSSSGTHITPLGIITDGKPPEWPSDPPISSYKPAKPSFSGQPQRPSTWPRPQSWGNRPLSSVVYKGEDDEKHAVPSESAPTDDESGKWVLLSSTRGYTTAPLASTGRGTRAFKFTPNTVSMSTNRGIRLTVLPAINNTSTLSHGGLLEVDKTFETVDAAANAANFAATLNDPNIIPSSSTIVPPLIIKGHKNKHPNKNRPKPAKQQANSTSSGGVRVFTAGQPSPTETNNRNKALIAAIGAGMLPATMAALVPMFLGKRRRRRDISDIMQLSMLLNKHRSRRHVDDVHERRPALVWYALPRSTFNVRRRRRAI